jgi:ABC-type transporter Mla subunit MlaD
MKKLFVFILLSIFLVACNDGRQKYTILFNRVDNINKGSEVKIKGVVSGKVIRMKLLDDSVAVTVSMKKGTVISSATSATIFASPIGSPYISLEDVMPVSWASRVLIEGDTLRRGVYSERKLLDEFISDSVQSKRIIHSLDTIADVLQELIKAKNNSAN